ncbi:hypothetical protein PAXRUDRAFT_834038 [Paxillus rubicundulus Ve08.2h10]|uniref:Uncharacterized protein n=1 Tax=Paxillus rubicundulus Ve08.2h10 TaxID=930991 RepID=A0A0D0DF08_9AGAM|nr:hypothetical protein PAXRUDRAFT_834038 [Paxillus rubicundulus Ve08.2h10]
MLKTTSKPWLFSTLNYPNKASQTPLYDQDPFRFLSRFDKSATNIKESALFCKIGQVHTRMLLPDQSRLASSNLLLLGPLGVTPLEMVPPIPSLPSSDSGR